MFFKRNLISNCFYFFQAKSYSGCLSNVPYNSRKLHFCRSDYGLQIPGWSQVNWIVSTKLFITICFKVFRLMTLFMGESVRRLSEALILPFNCSRYAKQMQREYLVFEKDYKSALEVLGISTNQLKASLDCFSLVADSFHRNLSQIDRTKLAMLPFLKFT